MPNQQKPKRFDGGAWFDRQVRERTRSALDAAGSRAQPGCAAYEEEYKRQYALFRAERIAKCADKREARRAKHHASFTPAKPSAGQDADAPQGRTSRDSAASGT